MSMPSEAAVLLITFNRADYTREVLKKIRQAKINKLYIANDAPREGNIRDKENRDSIRQMLEEIDWDCEIRTLFHEKNCGNGFGPVAALDWVFQHEEKIIVLEDDSVPGISFFSFCNHCLNKYETDQRIWVISGVSLNEGHKVFKNSDYIFTSHGPTFAWATWKRCWEHFDIELQSWPDFIKLGGFENVTMINEEGRLRNRFYNEYLKNPINSWDARFNYTVLSNSGYAIVPSKNLVRNIGVFGAHSNGLTKIHHIPAHEDFSIKKEPKFVTLNLEYELHNYKNHIRPIFYKPNLIVKLIRKIKKNLKLQ